jgi:hypothetical protein
MSDVATRPAHTRGRGTTRGRGGFRGTNRTRQANGDHAEDAEQGELGEMKKKYAAQLKSLKEVFPDWNDVDLLFALEETDGDLERTVDHISQGNVSQFSDVKKTKDRSRSKVKEPTASEPTSRPARGRGTDNTRGRARGDRGGRGRGATRGTARTESTAQNPSTSWGDSEGWSGAAGDDSLASGAADKSTAPATKQSEKAPVAAPAGPPKKTWASMFAQPKSAPPKPKSADPPISAPAATDAAPIALSDISGEYVEVSHDDATIEDDDSATPEQSTATLHEDSTIDLPPSKDKLTEDNVEHLPDSSGPAPVGTAASTVESSRGPDSTAASIVTPAVPRAAIGGYAASALKATTGGQTRSASFQRRLLEQQEAVVMPSKHAVDRAAVQFGSLGLNGESAEAEDEREQVETRAQPPQHSPTVAPRASLPPAPKAETAPEAVIKPAPGLPPAPSKDAFASQSNPAPVGTQPIGQPAGQGYNSFGRYGQSQDAQKAHDPFGSQTQGLPSAYESYSGTSQAPSQSQQATSQLGSTANDYSAYYDRSQYNQYYGFGQQGAGQETTARAGFGASGADSFANQTQVRFYSDSDFAANRLQPTPQAQASSQTSRFSETQQASGPNTPNPPASGHQHQGQQPHGQGQGQGQHGGFPGYQNHPYFTQPYYQAYMNQYAGYGGQGGFGAPGFNKGGMYGQPQHHGYGMPGAQGSHYDQHSSSPASGFGAGETSTFNRANLSDYARSGSAQPASGAQSGQAQASSGFGEVFGRSPGNSYQSAAGQAAAGGDDSLKPFGTENKSGIPTGPAGAGQPGRPTSAANNAQQGGQSQHPQGGQHHHHQGHQQHQYGGYPGQLGGQGSQYAATGAGGLSGGLGNQAAGYGAGYGSSFGSAGYGNYGRGGGGSWNQTYGGSN